MTRHNVLGFGLAALLTVSVAGLPIRASDEPIDYDSINKIKTQGLVATNSKVMEIASYLTDVYGPRLTGSPNIQKAGEWSVAKMKEWGLTSVSLEPWPTDPSGQNNGFPCGWTNDKFYLQAVSPQSFSIPGTPSAWSPGTNGLVRGEVMLVTETAQDELQQKYGAGQLRGKWIISSGPREIQAFWQPQATRFTKEELDNMETPRRTNELGSTAPGGRGGGGRQGAPGGAPAAAPGQPTAAPGAAAGAPAAGRGATPAAAAAPAPSGTNPCAGTPPAAGATAPAGGGAGAGRGGQGGGGFNRNAFLKAQGALGVLNTGNTGHGLYTIGGGSRSVDPNTLLAQISIPAEQYNRIARMLELKIPVTIEADIKNTYLSNPPMFNVVGEIRGTDKADELVMIGAHFDSWHASTGATDNAAGSAAMLEAMRILKQSGVPLRRTVRIGLWTGEEQGLIGSRLYVQQKFGGGRGRGGGAPAPTTPDHAKFSAYFNIDNGTGAIRGVYLQQNQAVGPIFRAWMEPFRNVGMSHLNVNNTGGTDHGSFDGAGLPGWQFIQDEVEYDTMTHHTNMDSYERLQPEDMRRNATIAAAFAFLAANRDEKLPRKPATPLPAGGRGGQ